MSLDSLYGVDKKDLINAGGGGISPTDKAQLDKATNDITTLTQKVNNNETSIGALNNKTQYMDYRTNLNAFTFSKDFDFQSTKTIKGLPDPTAELQATNKRYVDNIRNKFNRYLKWGDYGNNKSTTQNLSTYNFNLDNWIAGGVRGEYILIIKGNGKEYTFNFNLFDGLQNNGDKVVAQFAIPKDFDTIDLTNGQAIVGNETTHFWVITNGNNMRLKFQNPKNTTATIELWRKTYEPY